jgi:hypothetical protein
MQRDMFETWTPPWMPGETLFGLCSRYHRVAGHRLASLTCQCLFGHPRIGLSHDLPGRLDAFVDRTAGALGDAETILREHSVLAYYLPFVQPLRAQRVISLLRLQGPGSLKSQYGWLATRLGASHPLRACPKCMAEDLRLHGIATWRLVHQLPGVWVCPTHACALLVAPVKANGVERFLWHLPDSAGLRASPIAADVIGSTIADQVGLIADAAASILAAPRSFHMDADRFARLCTRSLIDRDLASGSGRWRVRDIGESFSTHLGAFARLPEGGALNVGPGAATGALRRLLDGKRTAHPLRYVIVALWLFGTWREFMRAYKASGSVEIDDHVGRAGAVHDQGTAQDRRHPLERSFLSLITEGGVSITRAASQLGIDTQTGILWSGRAGINVNRRPKKVNTHVRNNIVSALKRGSAKQAVARQHGVSVETITRILLADPRLHQRWQEQCLTQRRVRARTRWQRAIQHHPGAGIKEIRQLEPAAYTWLYRNDHDWLNAQNMALCRKVHGNHAKVNWASRDQGFSEAAAVAREELARTLPSRGQPKRSQIVRLVPGLRQKIRKLERLPLTRKTLFGNS